MQLNLCPLFSGSSGNSVYMACGGVKLLVDAGMSAARVEANLREIGVDIRNIDAILVTHEHIDHVRGLGVLCRRYGMPVYANEGTWQGILQKETGIPQKCMRTFYTGEDFYIGALNVHPFPVPHDAADPVGFAFDCQGLRCGVATDIGHISETWMRAVSGRILSGSSSGFSARGGTSTTRTAPARCASWRKAERAPSFFLTFLLTIIYLNWHIIRYAARSRRRASTWKTISASAFPGGTGFPTC